MGRRTRPQLEGRKSSQRSGKSKAIAARPPEFVLTPARRHDFYQTATTVIASIFLKKIVKDTAKVEFRPQAILLDLATSDPTPKRYTAEVPLYAGIDTEKSTFKILGAKLELTLAKADGASWPVLRGDEALTGEILQVGKAGRAT